MQGRVKGWLANGYQVRIVTARVNPMDPDWKKWETAIQIWCKKHLGVAIPVTCSKDYEMIALYDDRAKQVIPNTGILVEEELEEALSVNENRRICGR